MSHTHRSPNQDTSRRNLTGPLRKARAAKHARLRPRQLRCEPLEDRRLLSVFTNNTQTPIKDNGTITSTIAVPESFIVADLNVKVTIQHTRDPDLDVFLIAPDGTRVELFTDVGTTKSQNFTDTILDDEATTSITLGKAPFTGAFRPEGNLSVIEGRQVQGIWKLEITDDQKQSTGTLKSWSIYVTSAGVPASTFIDTNTAMLGNVGTNADRKIVVSNNGDAMAVWQESKGPGDAGPWNAMAATYVAGSWHTPEVIMEGNPLNYGYSLDLVGDGFGNYLAVANDILSTNQVNLVATRYVATEGHWRPAEILAAGEGAVTRASMARDADGVTTRAVVAWVNNVTRDAEINRLDNFKTGTWSGLEIAENLPSAPGARPGSTDVGMAQNGDFMLVFTEDTGRVYYRVYRNDAIDPGWTGPEAFLENRSEPANATRVVMNSSGEAMVVWRQVTGPDNINETWARRWNGVDWDITDDITNTTDPLKIVDSAAGTASFYSGGVTLSENGEAIMFWNQLRDGSTFNNAYVRHQYHDGTKWVWGEIIKLDTEDLGDVGAGAAGDPNGKRMNIAMDDAGNAAAVWTQHDGFYVNMWASQFSKASSTWSVAEKLENAPLDAVCPSVGMSAGVAQVIWTQSNGSLNHMYSATLTQLALSSPLSAVAALNGNDAAQASVYDEPLMKFRIDTVQRSESRTVESDTRDLSYTVGAAAIRIANDSWASDKNHTEVDDLFAQWESDPLQLLSLPDLGM